MFTKTAGHIKLKAELPALIARLAEEVEAENDAKAVRDALARLVELKDGPRDDAYERNKPRAWETAREVLGL